MSHRRLFLKTSLKRSTLFTESASSAGVDDNGTSNRGDFFQQLPNFLHRVTVLFADDGYLSCDDLTEEENFHHWAGLVCWRWWGQVVWHRKLTEVEHLSALDQHHLLIIVIVAGCLIPAPSLKTWTRRELLSTRLASSVNYYSYKGWSSGTSDVETRTFLHWADIVCRLSQWRVVWHDTSSLTHDENRFYWSVDNY